MTWYWRKGLSQCSQVNRMRSVWSQVHCGDCSISKRDYVNGLSSAQLSLVVESPRAEVFYCKLRDFEDSNALKAGERQADHEAKRHFPYLVDMERNARHSTLSKLTGTGRNNFDYIRPMPPDSGIEVHNHHLRAYTVDDPHPTYCTENYRRPHRRVKHTQPRTLNLHPGALSNLPQVREEEVKGILEIGTGDTERLREYSTEKKERVTRSCHNSSRISIPQKSPGKGLLIREITSKTSPESSKNASLGLPRRLFCEFAEYYGCDRTFWLDEEREWIEHVASHMYGQYPKRCLCWFCDEDVFFAGHSTQQSYKSNFENRMHHIAKHVAGGNTVDEIRPDYFFLEHLDTLGIITTDTYTHATRHHEGPRASELYPPDFMPMEMIARQERESQIIHDIRKEDRALKGKHGSTRPSSQASRNSTLRTRQRKGGSKAPIITSRSIIEYIKRTFQEHLGSVGQKELRDSIQSKRYSKSIDKQLGLLLEGFGEEIRYRAAAPSQQVVAKLIQDHYSDIANEILDQIHLEPIYLPAPCSPGFHHSQLVRNINVPESLLAPKDMTFWLNNRFDRLAAHLPTPSPSLDASLNRRRSETHIDHTGHPLSNLPTSTGIYRRCLKFICTTIGALVGIICTMWCHPVPLGMVRVTWKCRCGKTLHIDVDEQQEQKAVLYAQEASGSANLVRISSSSSNTRNSRSQSVHSTRTSYGSYTSRGYSRRRKGGSPPSPLTSQSSTLNPPQLPLGTKQYLLLCVRTGLHEIKLKNIDVTTTKYDVDLYTRIREEYERARGRLARNILFVPKAVQYIKFELIRRKKSGECVGNYEIDSISTFREVFKQEYAFNPCPPQVGPLPIQSHVFMHSFLNPGDHSGELAVAQLPKKVKDMLQLAQQCTDPDDVPYGWGIFIIEGFNEALVASIVFVILAIVLIIVLLWCTITKDMSGGMGIGQFSLALITILVPTTMAAQKVLRDML